MKQHSDTQSMTATAVTFLLPPSRIVPGKELWVRTPAYSFPIINWMVNGHSLVRLFFELISGNSTNMG